MSAPVPSLVDTNGYVRPDEKTRRPSDDEESKNVSPGEEVSFSGASSDSDSDLNLHAKWHEPPDSWESKHRWDPSATWTPEEQARLTRRLDWRVTAFACLCFAALQLDRGNIGNALSDNMLKDLNLTTGDYNTGQTIFYLSFLIAELPSQLISKKLGSDVWIPIQMMSWSAVAIGQVGLSGKWSFFVTRSLLGLIEGGFIADTILYLSYYFTSNELTIRLSFFWVSMTTTNIIGSLLAAGLLRLRGHGGLAGWRWLFAIEGAMTFAIGFWAYFYLPPGPTQTKKWFRPNGWFTEREEVIIVNKVIRDDPTKSDMHNRQGLSLKDLWLSATDYDLWPVYLLGITTFIAPATIQAYFTLSLRSLGYSTFQTNLLTIPSNVLFILLNLALAFTSKRVRERVCVSSIGSWWVFVWLIVLVTIPDHTNKWAKWAFLSLVQAYPYAHPILVSLTSMNAGSVRTRTVASSVYNMSVQAASLIASNIYQPHDKPYYHHGNRILLGIVSGNLVLFGLAKVWYIFRNKQKAKIWDSWTLEQRDEYIRTTKDKGNKRLDFRFLH